MTSRDSETDSEYRESTVVVDGAVLPPEMAFTFMKS